MDGLLPIIRRKRRPLVGVDAPPVVVGNVAPVPAVETLPVETVMTDLKPQASDANVTPKRSAR